MRLPLHSNKCLTHTVLQQEVTIGTNGVRKAATHVFELVPHVGLLFFLLFFELKSEGILLIDLSRFFLTSFFISYFGVKENDEYLLTIDAL